MLHSSHAACRHLIKTFVFDDGAPCATRPTVVSWHAHRIVNCYLPWSCECLPTSILSDDGHAILRPYEVGDWASTTWDRGGSSLASDIMPKICASFVGLLDCDGICWRLCTTFTMPNRPTTLNYTSLSAVTRHSALSTTVSSPSITGWSRRALSESRQNRSSHHWYHC